MPTVSTESNKVQPLAQPTPVPQPVISPPPSKKHTAVTWLIILGVISYIIAGFLAYVWSIACIGRSGSFGANVGGIILAILFGPFYWIYFIFHKGYCVA